VARHGRPQGAVASNDIAPRTNVLAGPGGPIGAAQGQASGATQPDLQSACMPGSKAMRPKRALRDVKTAVRTAHLLDLPGWLSPTTLLQLTTV